MNRKKEFAHGATFRLSPIQEEKTRDHVAKPSTILCEENLAAYPGL